MDCGMAAKADRRRRKALTRRSPGVLWPRAGLLEGLSPHQAEQWTYASARPLGLLTGTPGTGKTYTVGAVVRSLVRRVGEQNIAICAPTGKAAVRLGESMRRVDVRIQPRTIHSLLEIGRNGHDGDGWGFQRNESNPLDERVVIVDEASMLDADLAASLLRACGPGTHVLLVGDPYQLPPVGHGAPLRDLIAAGAPRGHLSEIQRNAGLIVRACAAIKDGKHFETCDRFDSATGLNLKHIEAAEPAEQLLELEKVHAAFSRSGRFVGFDCQVIVPTNKSGDLGRHEVNRHLQALLNPGGVPAPPNPFRVSDKIICLKNGWHQPEGGGNEVYVANGEIGQVSRVEPRVTFAHFFAPSRDIRIPMGKPREGEEEEGGAGCDFDLGYAITCHKSQGSEWPCVIILADPSPGARRVCSREWVYTAISRASQLCITIGREGVLQQMTARVSLEKRKTFLMEELGRIW